MIKYANNETIGKLILLYVLDRLECDLTEDTIIDMCYYQKKWTSYFTCKIALSELTKSGYIQETKNTEKTKYYSITPEGRSCLSFFYNDIPASIRPDIANFVKDNKLAFKRKQEYFYDSFKNKIVSLLEDDELLKRLQRAGNNFSKNYSWDRQCALFEKELLSIV